jgi:hypothetical protein
MYFKVGLNSRHLRGAEASAFTDSGLVPGDRVMLINEDDRFTPSIIVTVTTVDTRRGENSHGDLFISTEATKRLNTFPSGRPGIRTTKCFKLTPASKAAKTEPLVLPSIQLQVKLVKKFV